jgi:hypothetical protein
VIPLERCVFQNKSIYATDLTVEFAKEKLIREAGRNNQLFCYGCKHSVIYKRGEIRKAYFAHKILYNECDYDKYSMFCQKRSQDWKNLKELIYSHFLSLYPEASVEKSEKLIQHHWTDVSITFDEGKKFAIEIDDKSMASKKMSEICLAYKNQNITSDWVVLDKITDLHFDSEAYYIKRARLNESANNSLIVVDKDDFSIGIYKLDTNKYIYSGTFTDHSFGSNIFWCKSSVEKLFLNDYGLSVEGFDDKFRLWLNGRKEEFETADIKQGNSAKNKMNQHDDSFTNNSVHSSQTMLLNQNKFDSNPKPNYSGSGYIDWTEYDFRQKVSGIARGEKYIFVQLARRLKDSSSKEFYSFIDFYHKVKDLVEGNVGNQSYADICERILLKIGRKTYLK